MTTQSNTSDTATLAAASKYLVPRTFYFFIEHTEARGGVAESTGFPDGAKDRYQAEVALYRLDTEGNAADGALRVLRTWITDERKAFQFQTVEAPSTDSYTYSAGFDDLPEYLGPENLPALLTVTDRLEGDREYAAYARIHDGQRHTRARKGTVPRTHRAKLSLQ